ncbi:hypothetical protein HMPREF0201_02309 [Cedecea davisae DSM 4568]|uniref:Uncharacterized protein n=1 Tax=Cedecea davisae DSM 4568 TaxID=566551 RepID=S3IS30_9ENTR|nr:hypothetical protein HMPREF0201_02309 [Cedecea davisae DSM 4568]
MLIFTQVIFCFILRKKLFRQRKRNFISGRFICLDINQSVI